MPSLPISFPGHEATLAGELLLPNPKPVLAGKDRNPKSVVLFHGAGEGTRDCLRPQAEAFAAAGVAAFIFDRRGEGESTGARNMDLFVLAGDGAAAVEAVRAHPAVDSARVGLWGYSNGAWVAGIVASSVHPAFLILTGASAVSPAASEVFRRTEDLRANGVAPAMLKVIERAWTIAFSAISGTPLPPDWERELARLANVIEADPAIAALPLSELVRSNPQLDSVPRRPLLESLPGRIGSLRDFGYDPMPALESLSCPILAVLAENDANLPMAESLPRFRAFAASRPSGRVRIEVIPAASHRFTTPAYDSTHAHESLHPPRTAADYLPGYLERMANWAAATTAG